MRLNHVRKRKLTHDGFRTILTESVETSFNLSVYSDMDEWRRLLKCTTVRHQWDPERYLNLEKHPTRRAIQGWVVQKYVNELEDVTQLAHAVRSVVDKQQPLPSVPDERVYPVDDDLVRRLGIKDTTHEENNLSHDN